MSLPQAQLTLCQHPGHSHKTAWFFLSSQHIPWHCSHAPPALICLHSEKTLAALNAAHFLMPDVTVLLTPSRSWISVKLPGGCWEQYHKSKTPSKPVDYSPDINHDVTIKILLLKLQQKQTCPTKVWTCTLLSTQCSLFPQKPWTNHLSTSAGHEPTLPPLCKDILDLQQCSITCFESSVRPT